MPRIRDLDKDLFYCFERADRLLEFNKKFKNIFQNDHAPKTSTSSSTQCTQEDVEVVTNTSKTNNNDAVSCDSFDQFSEPRGRII